MRGVGVTSGLLVLFLAAASPAVAQLPILPDPSGGGGGPPGSSQPVLSPEGESLSYGANPSHTGEALEPAVFGPLYELWSRNVGGDAGGSPIISGGHVLISGGDSLSALDPATGNTVWSQPDESTWISADSGRVVSLNRAGQVRAFSVADGAPLWSKQLPDTADRTDSPPVASAGLALVWAGSSTAGEGTMYAFNLADGSLRWTREVQIEYRGMPGVDDQRVFVADSCGGAAAISLSTGVTSWRRTNGDASLCSGADARLFGGRLFSGSGQTYDAASGGAGGPLSVQPGAFSGSLAFDQDGSATRAFALDTGAPAWETSIGRGEGPEPLVVGGTVYVTSGSELVGLERSTGEVLSRIEFVGGYSTAPWSGIAAGVGRLFVSDGGSVTAFAPVLEPGADGLDIAASRFDVAIGKRVFLVGGLGSALREKGKMVELHAERPARSLRGGSTPSAPAHEDGTVYFVAKPNRNVSFRVALPGGPESPALTVYAYPRYKLGGGRAVSRRRGVVPAKVLKVPAGDLRGRRAFAYFGPKRYGRYTLLGRGRMKARGHVGRVKIRFRIPRGIGRSDRITFCVKGLAAAGYGRNDAFERACGRRHTRIPKPAAALREVARAPRIAP